MKMAKTKNAPKTRRKSVSLSTSAPTNQRPRRASQRAGGITIDLRESALRHLMIEQCKDGKKYLTVYRGSRAELVAAGVPEAAFALSQFPLSTTGYGQGTLRGSMRATDAGFEMEIDWGYVQPRDCSHPAIAELARMLLKDMSYWTGDESRRWNDPPDLAYPVEAVIEDERATDYKPLPGSTRVQLTPEFYTRLNSYGMYLFDWVHSEGEVMPRTAAVAKPPRLSLVSNKACGGAA
jgi:hypothetical protein